VTASEFKTSLAQQEPPASLEAPLRALWWDAHGDWERAHAEVDELETRPGMMVHAYLHRKQGESGNAAYWYHRTGQPSQDRSFSDEWSALLEELLSTSSKS
jgi:hypothetical protein